MPEFLVQARHINTEPYPPFVVTAMNESAARRMVQRSWLIIDSVRAHVLTEGEPVHLRMLYGPPINDARFDRDIVNLDAEPPAVDRSGMTPEEKSLVSITGLFFGWLIWWKN
ncbi:MAG: hypothetical protein ACRC33_16500 [Gemmataceae bacterium]